MNEPVELSLAATTLWPLLQAAGFQPDGKHPNWTGKVYMRTWIRQAGSKRDDISCHCRPEPQSVSLGAGWAIPGLEGRALMVSGINSAHMFRGQVDYPVPMRLPVLGGILERRFLARLLEDAGRTLQWLDGCATRAGALAELERAERNGPGRGTPAYEWAERYIRERFG